MFKNRWRFAIVAAGIVSLCLFLPKISLAVTQMGPNLRTFTSDGDLIGTLPVFPSSFEGGVSLATGDVNADGLDEIIIGAGPTGGPQIRVFDQNGTLLAQFFAFATTDKMGINVATGDVNGDGKADIIVAKKTGGIDSRVEIFNIDNGTGNMIAAGYAYAQDFDGGVNLTAGDFDRDGKDEIVTVPEEGIMHVRIFNVEGDGLYPTGEEFYAFNRERDSGASIAAADLNGNGSEDSIAIAEAYPNKDKEAKVLLYNTNGFSHYTLTPYGSSYRGGINVAAGDYNGDGIDEIMTGTASHAPHIRVLTQNGFSFASFFAYDKNYTGGVNIAIANRPAQNGQLVTTPASGIHATGAKRIVVDLSEQRLYAYEGSLQVNTFLISSGLASTPSLLGTTTIQRKVYSKLYSSTIPGDEYYLPNTLYNLQYRPGYYYHGAYWHNNFGRPMSHGCINIYYDNAKWLYEWAEIGTESIIQN